MCAFPFGLDSPGLQLLSSLSAYHAAFLWPLWWMPGWSSKGEVRCLEIVLADLHLMLYLNEAHSTKSLEKLGQESCVCAESSEELGQESMSLCTGFLKARISCV